MRRLASFRTASVLALLNLVWAAGCDGELQGRDELIDRLYQECRRAQSRMTPAPIRLETLYRLVDAPHEVEQLDEKRQQWKYHFPAGEFQFTGMGEPDHSWQDENPRVFVNLRGLR